MTLAIQGKLGSNSEATAPAQVMKINYFLTIACKSFVNVNNKKNNNE